MARTTPIRFSKDINGYASFLVYPFPNLIYSAILAANVDVSFTLPTAVVAYVVVFKIANGLVYVAINEPAVIPTSPTPVLSTSAINPQFGFEILGGSEVHMISPFDNTYANVEIYEGFR